MTNDICVPSRIRNNATGCEADVIEVIRGDAVTWDLFVVRFDDGTTDIISSEGLCV